MDILLHMLGTMRGYLGAVGCLWKDESGSSQGEWAVLLGLIALAAALWFIRLGGEEGLAEALATLYATKRKASHLIR